MKLMEIKELSPQDISEQLKKSRIELAGLRMKFGCRQLEDPSQIKKKRKEIARLLTIHTQKQKSEEALTGLEIPQSKPKAVKKEKKEEKKTKETPEVKTPVKKEKKTKEKSEVKAPVKKEKEVKKRK